MFFHYSQSVLIRLNELGSGKKSVLLIGGMSLNLAYIIKFIIARLAVRQRMFDITCVMFITSAKHSHISSYHLWIAILKFCVLSSL